MYGRHGLPAAGGGADLFPPDRPDLPATDDTVTSVAPDAHANVLERQRQLAQARSFSRITAGPSMSTGTSLSRGAPMMTSASFSSQPSTAWGGPASYSSGGSDKAAIHSSMPVSAVSSSGSTMMSPGKSGGFLADALKERDRKAKDVLGPSASEPSHEGPVSSGYTGAGASSMPAPSRESVLMPVAPVMVGAPGTSRTDFSLAGAAALDLTDLRKFLTTPTPRSAGIVQCYIERDRSGLTGRLYPTYCLYLKEGDRFLMAARKRTSNKTSNYLISMDKRDLNRESASYVGKLRSNFVGTEFLVYNDGAAPEKVKGTDVAVRQELGVVTYASNVLGSRGPRKMKVAVPKVASDGRRVIYQPEKEEESMSELFKAGHIGDMVLMVNKPPKWNDQVGAYVLNFNGRVTMASVKNFQLVSPDDIETVLLQFGRTGKEEFSLDYQWPLCPLQAFAIALSSFDYKLACE